MTYNTPTQEQFDIVINKFKKIIEAYPQGQVKMTNVGIHKCGTPMCHAGWYALASDIKGHYQNGTSQMTQDLGFDFTYQLKAWAHENRRIWGNKEGFNMFNEPQAFNGLENLKRDDKFGLQIIVDHWEGVKQRALEHGN